MIVSGARTIDKQTTLRQVSHNNPLILFQVMSLSPSTFISLLMIHETFQQVLNHSCVLLSKLHKVCPEADSLEMKHFGSGNVSG